MIYIAHVKISHYIYNSKITQIKETNLKNQRNDKKVLNKLRSRKEPKFVQTQNS